MSAARGGIKSASELLCVNFNQDNTCISTGTRSGYSITNCDPFGKVYSKNEGGNCIVEMLFCTSLVAIVGCGDSINSSTRRLQIINTKRQSTICELTFPTSIKSIKLNRRRLIVVLIDKLYIYDISNMKLLHEIETALNPSAICALSPSSTLSYLAYPSPLPTPTSSTPFSPPPTPASTIGTITIFDPLTLSITNVIQAHKSPLAILSINQQGTLLASASDKGTVIRIFNLPEGNKLYEFRRGVYPARIYSITFNERSSLLGVSSDSETVHIFKLSGKGSVAGALKVGGDFEEEGIGRYNSRESSNTSNGGYEAFADSKKPSSVSGTLRRKSLSLGRNLTQSVSSFLPTTVSGIWEQPLRDFAFLKLPSSNSSSNGGNSGSGIRSIVAISSTTPNVMIITSEGLFYSYSIDLELGGECILQKSFSLLENGGESENNL